MCDYPSKITTNDFPNKLPGDTLDGFSICLEMEHKDSNSGQIKINSSEKNPPLPVNTQYCIDPINDFPVLRLTLPKNFGNDYTITQSELKLFRKSKYNDSRTLIIKAPYLIELTNLTMYGPDNNCAILPDLKEICARLDRTQFRHSILTAEHSPYQLCFTIEASPNKGGEKKVFTAWTYFHVLIKEIKLYLEDLNCISFEKFTEAKNVPDQRTRFLNEKFVQRNQVLHQSIKKQIAPDYHLGSGNIDLILDGNAFKINSAEMYDNTSYRVYAELWACRKGPGEGDIVSLGPLIPLRVVTNIRNNAGKAVPNTGAAVGDIELFWNWECQNQFSNNQNLNPKTRTLITKVRQYSEQFDETPEDHSNCHKNLGGKKEPQPFIVQDKVGFFESNAIKISNFGLLYETNISKYGSPLSHTEEDILIESGMTSKTRNGSSVVIFNPSHIAGDNYKLIIYPLINDFSTTEINESKIPSSMPRAETGYFKVFRGINIQILRKGIRNTINIEEMKNSFTPLGIIPSITRHNFGASGLPKLSKLYIKKLETICAESKTLDFLSVEMDSYHENNLMSGIPPYVSLNCQLNSGHGICFSQFEVFRLKLRKYVYWKIQYLESLRRTGNQGPPRLANPGSSQQGRIPDTQKTQQLIIDAQIDDDTPFEYTITLAPDKIEKIVNNQKVKKLEKDLDQLIAPCLADFWTQCENTYKIHFNQNQHQNQEAFHKLLYENFCIDLCGRMLRKLAGKLKDSYNQLTDFCGVTILVFDDGAHNFFKSDSLATAFTSLLVKKRCPYCKNDLSELARTKLKCDTCGMEFRDHAIIIQTMPSEIFVNPDKFPFISKIGEAIKTHQYGEHHFLAHETGHQLFLPHAKTANQIIGSKSEFHATGDDDCFMTYKFSSGQNLHFCGLCALRLGGWSMGEFYEQPQHHDDSIHPLDSKNYPLNLIFSKGTLKIENNGDITGVPDDPPDTDDEADLIPELTDNEEREDSLGTDDDLDLNPDLTDNEEQENSLVTDNEDENTDQTHETENPNPDEQSNL